MSQNVTVCSRNVTACSKATACSRNITACSRNPRRIQEKRPADNEAIGKPDNQDRIA